MIPKPLKREKTRRRIRRVRKGGKAWQRRECDRLWSLIVRASGVCKGNPADCRCGGCLQAAHIFPRTYHATRWNLSNGIPLCAVLRGEHATRDTQQYREAASLLRRLLREWWRAGEAARDAEVMAQARERGREVASA